jgi:hypothetical protein
MYNIDHISLGTRHLYEGCHRLREEYGLDNYDGGWFKGTGIADRIVPLPGDVYVVVESVVDQRALVDEVGASDDGFDAATLLRGPSPLSRASLIALGLLAAVGGGQDHWMSWGLRTESLEELEELAERLDSPIVRSDHRILPSGDTVGPHRRTPSADKSWAKGLPNWYFWDDMSDHPSRREVQHAEPLAEVSWLELGGEANAMKEHIGAETFASLDLRFVDGVPGLYGVGLRTRGGEEIAVRFPAGALYLELH